MKLEKLKSLLKQNNMNQKELAEKINENTSNISNWINGLKEPRLESIIKIADLFDISLDELVGREQRKKIQQEKTKKQVETENEIKELLDNLSDEDKNRILSIALIRQDLYKNKSLDECKKIDQIDFYLSGHSESEARGIRTPDNLIKSQVLYRLS